MSNLQLTVISQLESDLVWSSQSPPCKRGIKMVFILGVNFDGSKLVKKALESFYGIGSNTSARIMARHHLHDMARVGSLDSKQVLDLTGELSRMKIENELRREVQRNINQLKEMKAYRGLRHALGMPVRGQKTRNQIATAIKLNRLERRF